MMLPKNFHFRPFRTEGFTFLDFAIAYEVAHPSEMLPSQTEAVGFMVPNSVAEGLWYTEFVVYEKRLDRASLSRMAQREAEDLEARGIPSNPTDVLARLQQKALREAIPTRKTVPVLFTDDRNYVFVLARGGKADTVEGFIRDRLGDGKRLIDLFMEFRREHRVGPVPLVVQWTWKNLEPGAYRDVDVFSLTLTGPTRMDGVSAKVSCTGGDALSVAASLPSGFHPMHLSVQENEGDTYHLVERGFDAADIGCSQRAWKKMEPEERFCVIRDAVLRATEVYGSLYVAAQKAQEP